MLAGSFRMSPRLQMCASQSFATSVGSRRRQPLKQDMSSNVIKPHRQGGHRAQVSGTGAAGSRRRRHGRCRRPLHAHVVRLVVGTWKVLHRYVEHRGDEAAAARVVAIGADARLVQRLAGVGVADQQCHLVQVGVGRRERRPGAGAQVGAPGALRAVGRPTGVAVAARAVEPELTVPRHLLEARGAHADLDQHRGLGAIGRKPETGGCQLL